MATTPEHTVSVVIPCYNGMPYLPDALDSVFAQTRPPGQVIVVDDGSSDGSADCVRAHAGRHPDRPIELIQQENSGESAARNAGINASTCAWVAQLDADDWWDARKLEKQLAAAERTGGDCVLVHSGQVTHHPDGRCNEIPMERAAERVGRCTKRLVEPVGLAHSSTLVRRDALCRIGGYDARLPHAVDIDLYFRLSVEGAFAFVPERLVHYRIHPHQTSWNFKLDQVRYHHRVVRRFFNAHPDLAEEIGAEFIAEALGHHVATKLESFWWNRRLEEFRGLLAFADEQGYRSAALGGWHRKARWPDWLIRLRDRLGSRN